MSAQSTQAVESQPDEAAISAARLAQANINPSTGLATDYLNHFNEAIMLLEMMSACPDCVDDFLSWKPMSYREHFATSRFKDRQIAIEAYDAANPAVRHCLETLADTMSAVLDATRAAMGFNLPPAAAAQLAERSAAWLKPLVARAGAVINGETEADAEHAAAPQAAVDLLMKR
jgi:hypothetical protein